MPLEIPASAGMIELRGNVNMSHVLAVQGIGCYSARWRLAVLGRHQGTVTLADASIVN